MVKWIDGQIGFAEKKVCDLGCGPGLYTQRFNAYGATTTGVDFSKFTLDYARLTTSEGIDYIHADYLADELPGCFDVITLIYTDLCVLSPGQGEILLYKLRNMLNPDGLIVLDVAGTGLLNSRHEMILIEDRLMGGFWAEGDYVGIQKSFIYEDLSLALDRYVIVEPNDTWQVFNWFQHFTPEGIESELQSAGFDVLNMSGDLTGASLAANGDLIGIIATPK